MKIRIYVPFICALLAVAAVFTALNGAGYAGAAELTAGEIAAREQYEVEVSQGESSVPHLKLDGSWRFNADIFAYADTAYAEPLAENVLRFSFHELTQYRIRFNVSQTAGQQSLTLYSVINVVDTTAPVIIPDDLYDDSIKAGDTIGIIGARAEDNSGETDIPVSVAAFLNGDDISSGIANDKLTVARGGELVIRYTAVDSSGNGAERQFTVEVTGAGEEEPPGGGCKSLALGTPFVAAALIGPAAAAFVLRRKQNG